MGSRAGHKGGNRWALALTGLAFLLTPGPAVAADGRLAFVTTRDGSPQLYSMSPDGSGQTRLTQGPWADTDPAWSPDGRRITFASSRPAERAGLLSMRADGSDLQRLTAGPDADPAWSPDGRELAFARTGIGGPVIMVVTLFTRATRVAAPGADPSWSPDGKRIAFTRADPNTGLDAIYTMAADGSDQRRLTPIDHARESAPAWSGDGRQVAFVSSRATSTGVDESTVWVIGADASQSRRVSPPADPVTGPRADTGPAWSPDGKAIAFAGEGEFHPLYGKPNAEVHVVDLAAGTLRRLTFSAGFDGDVAWQRPPGEVAPTSTFEQAPAAQTSDATPTFTFSATDSEATFQCRVDSIAFAGCASPHTTAPLDEGLHVFEVRAEVGGHVEPVPKRREVFVDLASPVGKLAVSVQVAAAAGAPQHDVFTLNADGTELANLTPGAGSDVRPAFSPDGSRIAFASDRAASFDVWVMGADGSNPLPVTSGSDEDLAPAWSADGRVIVFARRCPDCPTPALMSVDVTNPAAAVQSLGLGGADDTDPHIARNGGLAFGRISDPLTRRSEIAVVPPGGGPGTIVVSSGGGDRMPHWSPDSQALVFTSARDGDDELYRSGSGGEQQLRLTANHATDFAGVWSPDGARIAFLSDRSGALAIHTMAPDGSGVARVQALLPTITATTIDTGTSTTPGTTAGTTTGTSTSATTSTTTSGTLESTTSTEATQVPGTGALTVQSPESLDWQWLPDRRPDRTPPAISLLGGPAGLVNTRTVTVRFTADDAGATFRCAVDELQPVACASPYTTPQLADGPHTVFVAATDSAGNTSPPLVASFTVDATPPVLVVGPIVRPVSVQTVLDAVPAVLTRERRPAFRFSSPQAGAGFQCVVDRVLQSAPGGGGGATAPTSLRVIAPPAFAACTSPHQPAALSDGRHTFEVRATVGGVVDATPASHTFTVDATAPDTLLDPQGPGGAGLPDFLPESAGTGVAVGGVTFTTATEDPVGPGGTVGVGVACPAGGGRCAGSVTIIAPPPPPPPPAPAPVKSKGAPPARASAKRVALVLGRVGFGVAEGATRSVTIQLGPRARRMIARAGSLVVTARIKVSAPESAQRDLLLRLLPPAAPAASVALGSARAGLVPATVSCPPAAARRCAGRLSLRLPGGGVLDATRFSVRPGDSEPLRLRVSASRLALARATGGLRVITVATSVIALGAPTTIRQDHTLKVAR